MPRWPSRGGARARLARPGLARGGSAHPGHRAIRGLWRDPCFRPRTQQLVDEGRHLVEQVLAVVQHEQDLLAGEEARHIAPVDSVGQRELERAGDHFGNVRGHSRGQAPRRTRRRPPRSRAPRQPRDEPRLPATSDTREGDEPVRCEEVEERSNFGIAADQRRERRRKAVAPTVDGRQRGKSTVRPSSRG